MQAGSHDCGGVHRPGDLVTCYVTFAKSVDFIDLQVQFNLPNEDKPRQHGSYINFVLTDAHKAGPRTYAVSGVVGDCVPGTYVLSVVIARTAHDQQIYGNPGEVRIIVENDSAANASINKANETAGSAAIPQIVKTPPPDTSIFPHVTGIKPGPSTAAPIVDVATLLARLLHKPDSCGGKHKQGETVICRVQFAGNPKFQTVGLSLQREKPPASLYESQQCGGFSVTTGPHPVPLKPGLYEVKQKILNCASGKYKITFVTAFGYWDGDSTKLYVNNYRNGSDFRTAIVLKLKDITHSEFPAVVRVGSAVH